MPQLMLINPRKRRKRKMSALQKKYFGKRAGKRTGKRHKRAVPRARRRSVVLSSNPIRRRKYRRTTGVPSPMGFVKDTLVPSGIGAAGALGLDILLGFLPLPAMLKGPMVTPIVKLAGAVGIGAVAGMITNRRIGEQVAAGAVTVVLYNLLRGVVTQAMPTLALGDYDMSAYPSLEYVGAGLQVGNIPSDEMGTYDGAEMGMYGENQMGKYVS